MDTQLAIDTAFYDRQDSSTLCDWKPTADDSLLYPCPQALLSSQQIEAQVQVDAATASMSNNNDALDYMITAQYAIHARQLSGWGSKPELNVQWQMGQALLPSPFMAPLQANETGDTSSPTAPRSTKINFPESGARPEINVDVTTEVR
jgi:hypothetical protein